MYFAKNVQRKQKLDLQLLIPNLVLKVQPSKCITKLFPKSRITFYWKKKLQFQWTTFFFSECHQLRFEKEYKPIKKDLIKRKKR